MEFQEYRTRPISDTNLIDSYIGKTSFTYISNLSNTRN